MLKGVKVESGFLVMGEIGTSTKLENLTFAHTCT